MCVMSALVSNSMMELQKIHSFLRSRVPRDNINFYALLEASLQERGACDSLIKIT